MINTIVISNKCLKMHYKLKQQAIKLRTKQQLSYNAILRKIPVAKSTLSTWLKYYPLSREKILNLKRSAWKKSEAKIELFRDTMRKKREKEDEREYQRYFRKFKKISNSSLFISGLMLYLAEGSKTDNYTVSLANTDARISRFFVDWLVNFFKVPRSKIKLYLQLYPTMNIDTEVIFWLNKLKLGKGQVYKPFIRKLRPSSFSYGESFRHGTCAVILSNTKIKREIMMAIKAYLNRALEN